MVNIVEKNKDMLTGLLCSLLLHVWAVWFFPEKKPKMFHRQRGPATIRARWVKAPKRTKQTFLPQKKKFSIKTKPAEQSLKKIPPARKKPVIKKKIAPVKKKSSVSKKTPPVETIEKSKKVEKIETTSVEEESKDDKKNQKDSVISSGGMESQKGEKKNNKNEASQNIRNEQTSQKKEKKKSTLKGIDNPVKDQKETPERKAQVCIEVNEKGDVENFVLEDYQNCEDLTLDQIEKLDEWEFNEEAMKKYPRHIWISKVMRQFEDLGIEKVSFKMNQNENSPFIQIPSEEESRFYTVDQLDQVPHPFKSLNKPVPYPTAFKKKGQKGTVILKISINKKGEVHSIKVLESSGHTELDELALSYVELWNFRPGRLKGKIVNSTISLPINFGV